MAVTVPLPSDLEEELRGEHPDLERRVLEDFVVESFRRGDVSSGEAGRILGLESRWDAIRFLSERKVYPGYEVEDLRQDLALVGSARTRDPIGLWSRTPGRSTTSSCRASPPSNRWRCRWGIAV